MLAKDSQADGHSWDSAHTVEDGADLIPMTERAGIDRPLS